MKTNNKNSIMKLKKKEKKVAKLGALVNSSTQVKFWSAQVHSPYSAPSVIYIHEVSSVKVILFQSIPGIWSTPKFV